MTQSDDSSLPGMIRDLRNSTLATCLSRYGEEWVEFFRSLVLSFTHWVWDLPASEKSHHVFPFGLLAHSLDVMGRTARNSPTIYGPCLGLLHDCGRVFDLEIVLISGERWSPLLEPLLSFSRRAPYRIAWRQGRGLLRHEKAGLSLLQVLIPPPLRSELAEGLEYSYTAYCRRHDPSPPLYGDDLWDLVGEVQEADCQSAAASRTWPAPKADRNLARANPWGRLENKRGVYPDPSGPKTGTPQNAQNLEIR